MNTCLQTYEVFKLRFVSYSKAMAGEDDLDEFLEPAAYEESLFVEPALSSDDDVDIDFDNISAAEASLELYNELVSLKWDGVLRATQACRLAFWACKGGCDDPMLKKLGSKPPGDTSTGNYSKLFDRVAGVQLNDPSLYQIETPCHVRSEVGRSKMNARSFAHRWLD